jgi:lipopolysaccharide/colanic/teichoic acid biosynthesis glycosyltransferase
MDRETAVNSAEGSHSAAASLSKRAVDVAVAGFATIILAPVSLFAAGLVIARFGRPVFFREKRAGLCGALITVYKFRTMTNLRDARGELRPDAERLPAVGQALRALSIDELPQLLSVLRGEMSLVGPRPLPTRYLERYSADQARRHDVKPGITGLVQVSGRNLLSWDEKFALDIWYVDNWSLWLDVKILLRTLWHVLKRTGIRAQGEATMSEFLGSADCKGKE